MENMESRVIDLIDKFEELTSEMAPDVVDAALTAVRVSAVQSIILAVSGVVASLLVIYLSEKVVRYCRDKEEEAGSYMADWTFGRMTALIGGYATSAVFAIYGLHGLLDLWAWVGIFAPKLALAHRILGL